MAAIERDRLMLDVLKKSDYRKRKWYHSNLLKVLETQKEKRVKDVDTSIKLGKELMQALEEPLEKPKEVKPHSIHIHEDDSSMKPVPPEVVDILYGIEKGAREKYLLTRYKTTPENRFFFRLCTSWDYGWKHKTAHVPPRDVNHGRKAVIRESFYRTRNVGPDPLHYAQPSGGNCSICSDEYYCYFN